MTSNEQPKATEPAEPVYGQLAFEAYFSTTDRMLRSGTGYGSMVPPWAELSDDVQSAWGVAAVAVIEAYHVYDARRRRDGMAGMAAESTEPAGPALRRTGQGVLVMDGGDDDGESVLLAGSDVDCEWTYPSIDAMTEQQGGAHDA